MVFRRRPIRDIGGFRRGFIETQGFFLAKNLELSLALLLNSFNASLDYGRSCSNLDQVCNLTNNGNRVL